MNQLRYVSRLSNNYNGMRHGQSQANVENVIVSCIDNDHRGNYGLTDLGRQQALRAAAGSALSGDTVICCSAFARAVQTAQIASTALGAADAVVSEALRERCFGDWEGTTCDNYVTVWAADKASRDILLVSHGDTLQILQAGFLRMDPGSTETCRPSSPLRSADSTSSRNRATRHDQRPW